MKRSPTIEEINEVKALLKVKLFSQGKSQKQAAAELGMSEKTVSKYVNDEGWPVDLKKIRAGEMKVNDNNDSLSETLAKIKLRKPDDYPYVKSLTDFVNNNPIFKRSLNQI